VQSPLRLHSPASIPQTHINRRYVHGISAMGHLALRISRPAHGQPMRPIQIDFFTASQSSCSPSRCCVRPSSRRGLENSAWNLNTNARIGPRSPDQSADLWTAIPWLRIAASAHHRQFCGAFAPEPGREAFDSTGRHGFLAW